MDRLNKTNLMIFFFTLISTVIFAEKPPPYLDQWKHIVKENETFEAPENEKWKLASKVKTFNEFDGKLLLSFIREGDYVHAGEEEAIDLIFSYLTPKKNWKILDVACGLGGTANYIHRHDWGKVVGFDIDKEAIQYAKDKYTSNEFFVADVSSVSKHFNSANFDLICIVNSFVCFQDQLQCLKELRKLAHSSTQLVIFDYTDLTEKGSPLTGEGREISFNPIRPNQVKLLVRKAGWKINKYVNLSKKFEGWYNNFLQKVESKRYQIDKRFGKNSTNYTRGKYDLIYYALKNKWLGGCLIILSPDKIPSSSP